MLGDLAHLVERLLRMREALGSSPRISRLIFCKKTFYFKETEWATCTDRNDAQICDIPSELIFHLQLLGHVIRRDTIQVECATCQFDEERV